MLIFVSFVHEPLCFQSARRNFVREQNRTIKITPEMQSIGLCAVNLHGMRLSPCVCIVLACVCMKLRVCGCAQ